MSQASGWDLGAPVRGTPLPDLLLQNSAQGSHPGAERIQTHGPPLPPERRHGGESKRQASENLFEKMKITVITFSLPSRIR